MRADLYIGNEDGQTFAGPYNLDQIDEMINGDESVANKIFRRIFQAVSREVV